MSFAFNISFVSATTKQNLHLVFYPNEKERNWAWGKSIKGLHLVFFLVCSSIPKKGDSWGRTRMKWVVFASRKQPSRLSMRSDALNEHDSK